MNMLPNDHHPGPRCSCGECLTKYPDDAECILSREGNRVTIVEHGSRDEVIASLTFDITNGLLRHKTIALDTVLNGHTFDAADTAAILEDSTQGARAIERHRRYARTLTIAWLTGDPAGRALVDERLERTREEAL